MPIAQESKVEERLEQLKNDIKEAQATANRKRGEIEALHEHISLYTDERDALLTDIRNSQSGNLQLEKQIEKMNAENAGLEVLLSEANNKLIEEQQNNKNEAEERKNVESELEHLQKMIQSAELGKRKSEAEKESLKSQLKVLLEEITQQEETIAKLKKECKKREEIAKKLEYEIRAEEELARQDDSGKVRLCRILAEAEERLEREKYARNNADKEKRKADGALKIAFETLEELQKQHRDLESSCRKNEVEAHALEARIENIKALGARIIKENKDSNERMCELEEAIEKERELRAKTDRMRSELQRDLDETMNQVDEQNCRTGEQIEAGKKHEAEIARLRRDVESFRNAQETSTDWARKKNADAASELNAQIAALKRGKEQAEMERSALSRQLEQLNGQVDAIAKSCAEDERMMKHTQLAFADLQLKSDEQIRALSDLTVQRRRLFDDNEQMKQQLGKLADQMNILTRFYIASGRHFLVVCKAKKYFTLTKGRGIQQ
ncbi:unnamed protein product [Gongylonema pulchrum]|uniref:Myosin_tail_1 domain-containing protein n=1 Tax=Gongylonema pulchrum TaxID=637853 RepID=A0A183DAI8_9BILA|nr:unnamed protein product [Gongylonema pulchrum]